MISLTLDSTFESQGKTLNLLSDFFVVRLKLVTVLLVYERPLVAVLNFEFFFVEFRLCWRHDPLEFVLVGLIHAHIS